MDHEKATAKAAIGAGGANGKGILVCRERGNGNRGAPSLFTLGGGSVGFQIGAKATDVVFLVMNQKGAQRLLQDKVKLGADASSAPARHSCLSWRPEAKVRIWRVLRLKCGGGKGSSERYIGFRSGRDRE